MFYCLYLASNSHSSLQCVSEKVGIKFDTLKYNI